MKFSGHIVGIVLFVHVKFHVNATFLRAATFEAVQSIPFLLNFYSILGYIDKVTDERET